MIRLTQNKIPLLLSLVVHFIVFTIFFVEISKTPKLNTTSMSIVHTTLINTDTLKAEALARHKIQQKETLRKKRLAEKRHKAELALQKKRLAEKRHKAKLALQKKRHKAEIALHKKQLAQKKRRLERRHRQTELAKRKRQEKQRQEKLAKLKHEQALAQKKALQQSLAAEQSQLMAAQTHIDQNVIAKYKTMIVQAISQRWLVPQALREGLSCQLLIHVAPGGVVLDVSISKTSGDSVLDRSVKTAVLKASPLPVPTGSLFDKFRTLRLTVRPKVMEGITQLVS